MSISTIRTTLPGLTPNTGATSTGIRGRGDAVRGRDLLPPPATPAPAAPPQAVATPAQGAVSVSPPPGTDPELWKVLSSEERAFFARLGAMGPLTYGRVMTGASPAALATPANVGGRLDVRG